MNLIHIKGISLNFTLVVVHSTVTYINIIVVIDHMLGQTLNEVFFEKMSLKRMRFMMKDLNHYHMGLEC